MLVVSKLRKTKTVIILGELLTSAFKDNFAEIFAAMSSFLDILCSTNEFLPEQADKIKQVIRTKHVAKGQLLLRKGEVNAKSYFVKKGCLRCYSTGVNGPMLRG